MRVLGVDPGTRLCGWGVVERHGSRLTHIAHGTLRLGDGELSDRLVALDGALAQVVAEHAPEAAAVEAMFFAKNAQTAAKLGHARGVVLLALRRGGLSVAEYPPARVKAAVVGTGRAEKSQVGRIVAAMLALRDAPAEDAADALAIAITHLSAVGFAAAIKRSG
jgi:crossover junction endodeoxyribonuclease RuvC